MANKKCPFGGRRITIYYTALFSDPRYSRLLALMNHSTRLTDGLLFEAWRRAQADWLECGGIPEEKWEDDYDLLVRSGLARIIVHGGAKVLYMCGSDKAFAFLTLQKAKSDKAAKKRKDEPAEELLPPATRMHPNAPETTPNHPLTLTSAKCGPEPVLVEPELVPVSKNTNTALAAPKAAAPAQEVKEAFPIKNPVGIWCSEYKRAYSIPYLVMKKDSGMLTGFAKGRSEEALRILFACYFAMKDPLYQLQKHPLSLFFRDLPKIVHAARTGEDESDPKTYAKKVMESWARGEA